VEARTQALGAELASLRQELSGLAQGVTDMHRELRAGLESKTPNEVFERVSEELRSAQRDSPVQSTSTALVGEPPWSSGDNSAPHVEARTQALGAELASLRQELSGLAQGVTDMHRELRAGLESKTPNEVFERVSEELRSAQQDLRAAALVGEPSRSSADNSVTQNTSPESRPDLDGQMAVLRQDVSGLAQNFASMEHDIREELCRVHDEYQLASRGVGEALVEHRADQNRVFELTANHAVLSAKLTRHLADEEDQREERWENMEQSLSCLDAQLRADFAQIFARAEQHSSLRAFVDNVKSQLDSLRHEVQLLAGGSGPAESTSTNTSMLEDFENRLAEDRVRFASFEESLRQLSSRTDALQAKSQSDIQEAQERIMSRVAHYGDDLQQLSSHLDNIRTEINGRLSVPPESAVGSARTSSGGSRSGVPSLSRTASKRSSASETPVDVEPAQSVPTVVVHQDRSKALVEEVQAFKDCDARPVTGSQVQGGWRPASGMCRVTGSQVQGGTKSDHHNSNDNIFA